MHFCTPVRRLNCGINRALYIKVDQGDTLGINRYRLILFAAWALVAAADQAAAQTPAVQTPRGPTGSITGVVTGDAGHPLPGAIVTAQGVSGGRREVATTDGEGHYTITGLPGDAEYQVNVAVAGFASAATERVTVQPNAVMVVNFKLKLTVTESVGVTAETPLIERGASGVQQTITEQMAHSLPLAGRNFITLAMLAAGFTGNPNYPTPQGQQYWTNNVIVDGASHFSKWRSAPRTFYSGYGLETIREVRVLTNRFSAEYGETLATVTTAVTRSGTDEWQGNALFFLQDDALNARPVFADTTPPSGSQRYGFTLGGPIARERTHFFGSYEGRRARNHNIVVSPATTANGAFVPDDEDEHLMFFRVDHRRTPNDLWTARYNGQVFRWHDEPGGLSQPGTGIEYHNDVHTVLVTNRRILSSRLQNEARGQFARYSDVRTDLNPSVFVSYPGVAESGGTLGPYGYGADPEDTWEANDTATMALTAHSLRIGGGLKYVRAHNTFLNYGRGAYYLAGPTNSAAQPYLFIQGLAPSDASVHADPRALAASAFVQDDWRVRRGLTLNLGLRYDVERVSNVKHFDVPADANNFQPRLGVAWEPWPTGKWLIRGGIGLYTQQHLLLYINRVQLEAADGTATIALGPESPLFPTFPNVLPGIPAGGQLPPRDIHQAAPDFHNPYSLQVTAGVERLFGRVTLSADYVYLDGRDLMSLVDANAPAPIVKPNTRTIAQADATRPLAPVPGTFRKVLTLGNEGLSWYRALQVKAERTSGRVQMLVSYTFAHADDMANYLLPEDSRNIAADKGRADSDVHHNVSAGLTWQLPGTGAWTKDWSISGLGIFHSNRPYTIFWGDDRYGTTQNDARPGDRNTGQTGAFRTVDLAVARKFTVGTKTIEGRVEAFNVFDAINYDQYVGSLLSFSYAQPVSAFPSRRIQLAGVVRF